MIPGIVAGQMRALTGGGTLWTPLNMATVPQIYLDAQDSVVTDVSGFASAISNLGAMGAAGDFSQGTAANRPSILPAELNGKRVLRFDGTNDVLVGSTAQQLALFQNVAAAWGLFVAKKRLTDAGTETRRMFHASSSVSANVRFACHVGINSGLNMRSVSVRRLDADAQATLASSVSSSGVYDIELFKMSYATREGSIYANGAIESSNSALTPAAGNTSDTASANPLGLGARYDGAVPADVDIAAVVIGNTEPSAADIDKLFGWAAHKYGLTASLPPGHPYKTVAPTV